MDLRQVSDRDYLAEVGKRPGMFVGRASFAVVTAFLTGYDQAAARRGRPVLDGWREWLVARRGRECNHAWEGQVLHLALPEGWRAAQLSADQEKRALSTLFELLDEFLAEQETLGASGRPASPRQP